MGITSLWWFDVLQHCAVVCAVFVVSLRLVSNAGVVVFVILRR